MSESLDRTIKKSRIVWFVVGIVIFAVSIYLKQTHLVLPVLNLDGGAAFFALLFITGLFWSIQFGNRSNVIQDLVAQGQYKLAETALRRKLDSYRIMGPQSSDYVTDLIMLSRVCRETEQFAEAEGFAEEALDVLQRNKEDWTKLDSRPMNSKEASLHALNKELRKCFTPLEPDALFELAATQFELGKFNDAMRSLKDATAKLDKYIAELRTPRTDNDPTQSSLFTKNFVLAGMQTKNSQSAKDELILALRAASKAELLLAKVRSCEGLPEEGALARSSNYCRQAIAFIDSQVTLKADIINYLRRAICYIDLGEYKKAIADLNQALDLDPPKMFRSSLLTNRGECFNRMNKLDLALLDFNTAVSLNPESGVALRNRAEVYERLGNEELAALDKQKAMKLGYLPSRLEWMDLNKLQKEFEAG